MIKFAGQLKKYRNLHSMSQDVLAEKLFITRQAISKWESGESTPDLNNLVKLSNIFNVSLDDLILGIEHDSSIDNTEFTFDPRKNRYVRRYGKMNFWDFSSRFWWLILAVVGLFGSIFHSWN